ncbi:hypothetical protein BV25DRAFT_1843543 [Artomyces pyxidatus]|uniref:Uncharacterized protein n=1 Tax=Artomyces pyxidatus TaxID=48021 RepID=A0ACB8SDP4_9AGAM|nr:hypothetical protein BV25DRAFT_1843543 [Artomyces pyxidatus]
MSKRARGIKESAIRGELLGKAHLSYRSREREPARTDDMVYEESRLSTRCSDVEGDIRDANPDDWIPTYVKRLQAILEERLSEANDFVGGGSENGDDIEDSERLRRMHAHRRLVAGVHQEIEIIKQGVEARSTATLDRAFILQGCRLNKTAFRRLYGF